MPKVKWDGRAHQVRKVQGYEWKAENGFIQDVEDDDLVGELLRNNGFSLVEVEDTGEETPVEIEED